MDELSLRLRDLVERSAAPVGAEEAVARSRGRYRSGPRRAVLVGALVAFVALVGVGLAMSIEDGEGRPLGPAIPPESTTPSTPASDVDPDRCIFINDGRGTARALESLLHVEGLSVGPVASVQSDTDEYEQLFFLSAEIDGPGYEGLGDIATWAGNMSGFGPGQGDLHDLPDAYSTKPVNGLAQTISDGVGAMRLPSMENDGAEESQACVAPRPVPDLTGLPAAQARTLLEGNRFEVQVREESHPVAALGEVVRQIPAPRTEASPGDVVVILVSSGPTNAVVPDVVGLSEIEAANLLQNAGFEVAFFEEPSGEVPEGYVVRTTPATGEPLASGGTVTVVLSSGALPLGPGR